MKNSSSFVVRTVIFMMRVIGWQISRQAEGLNVLAVELEKAARENLDFLTFMENFLVAGILLSGGERQFDLVKMQDAWLEDGSLAKARLLFPYDLGQTWEKATHEMFNNIRVRTANLRAAMQATASSAGDALYEATVAESVAEYKRQSAA